MTGIVLSASVRQNLLSLQSTASLLATTQNDLATGNKVNSALDNPTNYFTAQGLNNRASDIGNLLDSIGNGVQVLQAANTGITSLQSLVSSAQSIANQVLQTPVGYSTKSNVTSSAITGATADNLLGPGSDNTVTGTAVDNNLTTAVAITAATKLVSASNSDTLAATPGNNTNLDRRWKDHHLQHRSDHRDHRRQRQHNDRRRRRQHPDGRNRLDCDRYPQRQYRHGIVGQRRITRPSHGYHAGSGYRRHCCQPYCVRPWDRQHDPVDPADAAGRNAQDHRHHHQQHRDQHHLRNRCRADLDAQRLNTALAANDLQASISTTGQINIVTSNDAASSTIGTISGTASVFTAGAGPAPVADPNSQATRASLVAQYNNVLAQINTTAQDSSFNGVNLLNGDTLKLVFNETGKSTLSITGVTFNDAGLGLANLTSGTDFLDNNSANTVLSSLNAASHHAARGSFEPRFEPVDRADPSGLQQEPDQRAADRFVQPDLADTNQEAANSQALSTRQSIAVSALALANQSQQSVLQLLR